MKLATIDWEIFDVDYSYPELKDILSEYIIVTTSWTWVSWLYLRTPEWFKPIESCDGLRSDLLGCRLDVWRAAKIYYALGGYAELTCHGFITQFLSSTNRTEEPGKDQ